MSYINTPNMSLPVPVVGAENGPQYAIDVNSCFTLLDQHDHSPGKGVQITTNGLNINADLTFQGNFATVLAGLTLDAQSSTPANNTIYENGDDLYFVDGLGNNVRITQNGGVAGAPGSISNLTPPASAAYVSGSSKFVWQSNTNIAANMDFGSAILRNLSPNSTFGLTLAPPAGLASNFTVTLPTLPVSQSFMTIDSSGNIATPAVYPLQAAGIANNTITNGKFAAGTQIPLTTTTQTSGYTALVTDGTILCDTSATSAFTVTLYSAASNAGLTLRIKKLTSDFKAITVATTGGETIDGAASTTLNTVKETILIQSDGSNWQIISREIPSQWVSSGLITFKGTVSDPTKGTTSVDRLLYKRDGQNIRLRYEYSQTGAGSGGSGVYYLAIPSGITIDTSLISINSSLTSNANVVQAISTSGQNGFFADQSNSHQGTITPRVYDSTHVVPALLVDLASFSFMGPAGFASLSSNTVGFAFEIEVPVVGWNS